MRRLVCIEVDKSHNALIVCRWLHLLTERRDNLKRIGASKGGPMPRR